MKHKHKRIRILWLIIVILIIIIVLCKNSILRQFYPFKYRSIINRYAYEYSIDPLFVASVIKTESNFDRNAKSSKGATGLMQLTPATGKWIAKEMDIENYSDEMLLDPETNIKMGCWYLNDLKKEFNGNKDLILAAYNGGRGNVKNWLNSSDNSKDGKTLNLIPFKETDMYVKKVKVTYNIYSKIY